MYDEMSRTGSVGFQWGIAGGTTIGLPPVYHHGSEELKNRVMPPCVKGEKVCCLAITEPTAGSDVANLKCTAKLEGDFYILNGEKKWITNGIFADYFTVACRTGKPGVGGISLLLVEKGMEGLECRTFAWRGLEGMKMKCSGAWSSGTTYITFDDVKVPKGNLLGKEGKGFQYMMQNFNHERFAFCAMSTRFARVCLEDSLKFAGKRKTFGPPGAKRRARWVKLPGGVTRGCAVGFVWNEHDVGGIRFGVDGAVFTARPLLLGEFGRPDPLMHKEQLGLY
eukprot:g21372.t1